MNKCEQTLSKYFNIKSHACVSIFVNTCISHRHSYKHCENDVQLCAIKWLCLLFVNFHRALTFYHVTWLVYSISIGSRNSSSSSSSQMSFGQLKGSKHTSFHKWLDLICRSCCRGSTEGDVNWREVKYSSPECHMDGYGFCTCIKMSYHDKIM